METGDIILFEGKSLLSYLLEFGQGSKYSHVGIYLKSPTFLHPDWSGNYILQAGYESDSVDEESKKHLCGVQVTPFNVIVDNSRKNGCKLWHRKLSCERNDDFYKIFKEAYDMCIDKPYDFNIFDWISGKIDLVIQKEWISYRSTTRFFCSALVAFMYVKLGFIEKELPWTLIAPTQFSAIESDPLTFKDCVVDEEVRIVI